MRKVHVRSEKMHLCLKNEANAPCDLAAARCENTPRAGARWVRAQTPGALRPVGPERREAPLRGARDALAWTRRVVANFWQILGKISLVFGCIGPDLCK